MSTGRYEKQVPCFSVEEKILDEANVSIKYDTRLEKLSKIIIILP